MKEKTDTFNQGKRYFFYILMFAILGWFIFMQIFGADERSSDTSAASVPNPSFSAKKKAPFTAKTW